MKIYLLLLLKLHAQENGAAAMDMFSQYGVPEKKTVLGDSRIKFRKVNRGGRNNPPAALVPPSPI